MGRKELPVVFAPSVSTKTPGGFNRWWRAKDPAQAGADMVAKAMEIETAQHGRMDVWIAYASLYAGRPMTSLYQFGSNRRDYGEVALVGGHSVTWNVAQSCVDTLGAKIAKNRPRPVYQTFDGNFGQKRRAKLLTKFTDGLFYESDFYNSVAAPMFQDASVFDGGICQVVYDDWDETITPERVLPAEILIDPVEAIYGRPATLYRRKFYARDLLLERFARGATKDEARAIIDGADGSDPSAAGRWNPGIAASDMVPVFEAWRLPVRGLAGRHTIAMRGLTLLHEPYDKSYFPFAKYIDTPLSAGWWGKGVVEQVVGIQLEVNKLLRRIQQAQHLMAVPRVFVQKGSGVVDTHINNDIGAMVEYTGGVAPVISPGVAMSPEVYQHLQTLYGKAFELTGISEFSATGIKPAGLNSGAALREHNDIDSQRFIQKGQRWEQLHLDVARIMVDMARDIYASGKDVEVRAPSTRLLEQIPWSKVNLKEDAYVMRASPASLLPTTPAGRVQAVQDMIDGGLIQHQQGMALLDIPDLESVMSLEVAAYQDVERTLEKILEDGEYVTPEPYMDLNLCMKMGQSAYLRARADNAPEERLDKLARFMDECDSMLKSLAPPPPMAGPPGAPPVGPPGPPGQPMPPGVGMPGMPPPDMGGMPPGPPPGLQMPA